MNKRPFLIGIGIGIMIGAALLQLMIVGQRQAEGMDSFANQSDDGKLYTQEELDKQLAEQKSRIETELGQAQAGNKAKDKESDPTPTPASTLTPTSADTSSAAASGSATSGSAPDSVSDESDTSGGGAAKTEDSDAEQKARKIVRIPPNSSLQASAEILFENDIITNIETFTDLMRTAKVRAGYFAFTGEPTLDEVKRIITGKPLPPEEAKKELANPSSE